MKKIIFFGALLLIALTTQSQENNLDINASAGIPIGGIEDTHSFAFELNASYFYAISEQTKIGPSVGYLHFLGKDVNGITSEDLSFLPIAAAFRFNNDEDSFFVRGDLGYAIALSPSGIDGGVYFKPTLGYNVSENFNLTLSYTGVATSHPTYSFIGIGAGFSI